MSVRSQPNLMVVPSRAFQPLGSPAQPKLVTELPVSNVFTSVPSSGRSAVGLAVGFSDGDSDGDLVGETCDSTDIPNVFDEVLQTQLSKDKTQV